MSDAGEPKADVVKPVEDKPVQPPLENALRKISENRPQILQEMMMGFGSMGNPLHNKMNAEHITQVLDLATKHDEQEFILAQQSNSTESSHLNSNRRYTFWSFIIVLAFLGVLVFVFQNKPEVLIPILTGFGGLFTGGLAGYGLARSRG